MPSGHLANAMKKGGGMRNCFFFFLSLQTEGEIEITPPKKNNLPDDVGVFVFFHLLEKGNLPERRHGHTLFRQRHSNLFKRHHLTLVGRIPGLVHRSIGS